MKLPDRIELPDWLGYALLVVTAPVWLGLLAAIGTVWLKRKAVGPHNRWTRWFAWYPVDTGRDGKRWLEMVERRSSHIMGNTAYRLALQSPPAKVEG